MIKYRKHICLGIFSTIIFIMFIALILQDNQTANKNKKIRDTNNIEETVTTLNHIEPNTTTQPNHSTENITSNSEAETTSKAISPKKLIDFNASHPYLIRINRDENFAVVYGMDKEGMYSIPYKAFVCSTGKNPEDTPLGAFDISVRYRWRLMVDGTYAQYAIRIFGQIMLHSVPYEYAQSDSLEYWEYNKLGKPASLGCVRFRAKDIKWIYDHCNEGTKVNIYSEPGEEPPLKIRKIKKIKRSNPNKNWDPTDPDKNNPWKKQK